MKRVKLCFQGRETALPTSSQFTIITVSVLQRSAFGQLCHNKSKCYQPQAYQNRYFSYN